MLRKTIRLFNSVVKSEQDIVFARQKARQIAAQLGFDAHQQTRIATAISEIARNAVQYAGDAQLQFLLDNLAMSDQQLVIIVKDLGPGIANVQDILMGRITSASGRGMGIQGAKRLMDAFQIETSSTEGTRVIMRKALPKPISLGSEQMESLMEELARRSPQDPHEEVKQQNRELLRVLADLQHQQDALTQLNRELDETNRGVLALYAELDQKAEVLRRVSETKSSFLSNMTHEFRTPLNSILSLSSMLLEGIDGELSPEQRKQVGLIRRSAETLSELVNDLLDIAKVEAGKIAVAVKEFAVEDTLGTLRGMFRPLFLQKPAVELFVEDPSPDLPKMFTDEGKVAQILRNLVSNALKYTEQGQVRVRASKGKRDTIVFSVIDTGIGLAPENQARIFEDFVQINSPQQKKAKGTGLGLSLSKRLAELLGGEILVASELGKGSEFSLIIPVRYAGEQEVVAFPSAESRKNQIQPAQEITKNTVLIVDDEEISRYLLGGLLKEAGCQVVEAQNGDEGLKRAREERPALIFLDLRMPGMSGEETLIALKNDPQTRDIPVAIYTSCRLAEPQKQRLLSHAVAVLSKETYSRTQALAQVKDVLRRAGLVQ